MIEQLIDNVLKVEGGYVNHPADRGGPTKYGITLKTLEKYRGQVLAARDVEALTLWEARAIYRTNYWAAPGFARLNIPEVVMDLLFDMSVNHGPTRAVKILQDAIAVLADGDLGPITKEFAERMDPDHLMALILAERVEFYGRLITRDPSQSAFAHGWMRRCARFIQNIPQARSS